ncbi:hypothetical protein SAMN05661008_01516 [Alkalithermobacter thermoalcaliphilus JW-YL-7 = DSM 7308]|uniref:Uncharacterized protein n=1 Tax=Alkalithermobacter thermoalcaliphilus JW-YL-7 = DSM 7308 TaxID=1121328 RepID=A0A150FR01_CLOPD|nr:hypothetical protein JWYL7_1099 [[Clostridium] paradoxum JW-YL-7 = DSM 7308]SHL13225.1 hypothetical protein SAMN05661008_01516 [[Clostridium] paradoxum JW-YL-7 = DSM 7308]
MKKQFNTRIDNETAKLIQLYYSCMEAKTNMKINKGDINRQIINVGIKTLIKQNGGLEKVKKEVELK